MTNAHQAFGKTLAQPFVTLTTFPGALGTPSAAQPETRDCTQRLTRIHTPQQRMKSSPRIPKTRQCTAGPLYQRAENLFSKHNRLPSFFRLLAVFGLPKPVTSAMKIYFSKTPELWHIFANKTPFSEPPAAGREGGPWAWAPQPLSGSFLPARSPAQRDPPAPGHPHPGRHRRAALTFPLLTSPGARRRRGGVGRAPAERRDRRPAAAAGERGPVARTRTRRPTDGRHFRGQRTYHPSATRLPAGRKPVRAKPVRKANGSSSPPLRRRGGSAAAGQGRCPGRDETSAAVLLALRDGRRMREEREWRGVVLQTGPCRCWLRLGAVTPPGGRGAAGPRGGPGLCGPVGRRFLPEAFPPKSVSASPRRKYNFLVPPLCSQHRDRLFRRALWPRLWISSAKRKWVQPCRVETKLLCCRARKSGRGSQCCFSQIQAFFCFSAPEVQVFCSRILVSLAAVEDSCL